MRKLLNVDHYTIYEVPLYTEQSFDKNEKCMQTIYKTSHVATIGNSSHRTCSYSNATMGSMTN